MHPYEHYKLTEYPDVADIRSEGRKSSIGRVTFINGKPSRPWNQHNKLVYRGYSKSKSKKFVQRNIKRASKQKAMKQWQEDHYTSIV